jgi:hypothetical protein
VNKIPFSELLYTFRLRRERIRGKHVIPRLHLHTPELYPPSRRTPSKPELLSPSAIDALPRHNLNIQIEDGLSYCAVVHS